MAYIFPQGVIELCKGVPLSPDYRDVMYCQGETQAYSFISAYITTRYTNESYTRGENGTLRIASIATAIIDCNYLVFQNVMTGGENKRFFAFITSVNYINNRCTEIEYVIDDFMTWFPALVLGECFVEREIPATDELYEHLIDENLEVGDYVIGQEQRYSLNQLAIVMLTTTDTKGEYFNEDKTGEQSTRPNYVHKRVNGIETALYHWFYSYTQLEQFYHDVNEFNYNGQAENVINILIVPGFILNDAIDTYSNDSVIMQDHSFDEFQGYTPKNKKLYSYPYCQLIVSNNSGQTKTYKWEDFYNPVPVFQINGVLYSTPAVTCFPESYKGIKPNFDECITINNFPPMPWINDAYQAYQAQNRAANSSALLIGAAKIAAGTVIAATGVGTFTGIGLGVSGFTQVAATMTKIKDAEALPVSVPGLLQADSINLVLERVQFNFYGMTIKKEMAEAIDDYFSAYGYACHKVKRPDITSRPYWNYVKTNGCILLGSAPAEAKRNIINAMDNGVRFWHSIQNIGNFHLPN